MGLVEKAGLMIRGWWRLEWAGDGGGQPAAYQRFQATPLLPLCCGKANEQPGAFFMARCPLSAFASAPV